MEDFTILTLAVCGLILVAIGDPALGAFFSLSAVYILGHRDGRRFRSQQDKS